MYSYTEYGKKTEEILIEALSGFIAKNSTINQLDRLRRSAKTYILEIQ